MNLNIFKLTYKKIIQFIFFILYGKIKRIVKFSNKKKLNVFICKFSKDLFSVLKSS